MKCKDKFLIQSIVAWPRATTKDITSEMGTTISYFDVTYNIRHFPPTLHNLIISFLIEFSLKKSLAMRLKNAN